MLTTRRSWRDMEINRFSPLTYRRDIRGVQDVHALACA